MDTKELKVEMIRNNDTGIELAKALGISRMAFSNKINMKTQFTRNEILLIRERYNLSADRVMEIFFAN